MWRLYVEAPVWHTLFWCFNSCFLDRPVELVFVAQGKTPVKAWTLGVSSRFPLLDSNITL